MPNRARPNSEMLVTRPLEHKRLSEIRRQDGMHVIGRHAARLRALYKAAARLEEEGVASGFMDTQMREKIEYIVAGAPALPDDTLRQVLEDMNMAAHTLACINRDGFSRK